MKSLKQILQRMGWAEDQAVNFIEKAGGATPVGLPADTSSLLYHVRKLQDELSLHIDGSTEEDTTATEPEPETGGLIFRDQFQSGDLSHEEGGVSWVGEQGSRTFVTDAPDGSRALSVTSPACT